MRLCGIQKTKHVARDVLLASTVVVAGLGTRFLERPKAAAVWLTLTASCKEPLPLGVSLLLNASFVGVMRATKGFKAAGEEAVLVSIGQIRPRRLGPSCEQGVRFPGRRRAGDRP